MLFERFLTSGEACAALDDRAFVQAMLDFEAALARAQAAVGDIPEEAAPAIASACEAGRYDPVALAAQGAQAGSLAIPLVQALTREVRRGSHAAAAAWVHFGATSQDVLDTAQVLVARPVLALVDRDLGALADALLALAQAWRACPVLGRTLMQPAQVTSVDAKAVAWLAPLVRARARLRDSGGRALQLQLGGAVGTRAALGPHALQVARDVAVRLGLPEPGLPWHAQRDTWVELGCALGLAVGSLGKLARDLSLGGQAELGEWREGGPGGSSTMPHKRNPVGSMVALAASIRAPQRVAALLQAMPQAQERGLGDWQAELAEFPALLASAHGAAHALRGALDGLALDPARMRQNIEAQHGLVHAEALSMRLARDLGKARAHEIVEGWSRQALSGRAGLRDIAAAALAASAATCGTLGAAELDALFDADAAARAASDGVQAALGELQEEMAALDRAAPWARWLPPDPPAGSWETR